MATNPKTGSEEFGELLRQGRERLGMSRRDLVEATGLSYPYVSQLETGYRQPSPAAIQKLADALQLTLDDLFSAMAKGRQDESSVIQQQESPSRWVRNVSFSGAGAGGAGRSARFAKSTAAAKRSSPSMEPPGNGDTPPEVSPARVEQHLSMAPAPGEIDADRVVERVVDLVIGLPAPMRLATLARIQAEIVQSVIDDGTRDRSER